MINFRIIVLPRRKKKNIRHKYDDNVVKVICFIYYLFIYIYILIKRYERQTLSLSSSKTVALKARQCTQTSGKVWMII